jgi:uncharacterized protein with HEPN domain
MKKNPEIFLKHIIESIESIEKYTENISQDKFFESTRTQDAVVRRLEIIGEAVKNLPMSFRNKYPDIPWRKAAGMRDVLIHEYFGVDLALIWEIIKKDLPNFKKQILGLLQRVKRTLF